MIAARSQITRQSILAGSHPLASHPPDTAMPPSRPARISITSPRRRPDQGDMRYRHTNSHKVLDLRIVGDLAATRVD